MKTLSDSEMKIANIVWENPGISTSSLAKICEKEFEWKRTTTYTLVKRMMNKGFVTEEYSGLSMAVSKEEFYRAKTKEIINDAFHGSLPVFFNLFVNEYSLSKEEQKQLKEMIEEMEQGN